MRIGLDVGGTNIRAYDVYERQESGQPVLAVGERAVKVTAPVLKTRVTLEQQLSERDSPRLSQQEKQCGALWVREAASAIARVAAENSFVRVGVCAPGLKTSDQRGIDVFFNGPRMPRFCDDLEESLTLLGVCQPKRISRLLGDGEACGLGEQLAAGGKFRDAKNAYYMGGGTGLAEALMVDGVVRSLDSTQMQKALQLKNSRDESFEELIAAKHLNRRYECLSGKTLKTPGELESRAVEGDSHAREVFAQAAERIADLILIRERDFASEIKRPLERVVLGLHTGRIYLDPAMKPIFGNKLDLALVHRSLGNIVVGSDLREAPAIGAASTAL